MANTFYPKYKEAVFNGGSGIALTGTLKVTLIDSAQYTYNAAHDFWDDVPVGARIGTQTLANKTYTNGVLDADDVTFPAVAAGTYEALIFWLDTGVESTSRLVFFLDTATGLPVTSNSNDIPVTWDNGANKIFAL